MPDEKNRAKGLYHKYYVNRADGEDAPGRKHYECRYFVLDYIHDRFAAAALRAYASACKEEYPKLAADLRAKARAAERRFLDA